MSPSCTVCCSPASSTPLCAPGAPSFAVGRCNNDLCVCVRHTHLRPWAVAPKVTQTACLGAADNWVQRVMGTIPSLARFSDCVLPKILASFHFPEGRRSQGPGTVDTVMCDGNPDWCTAVLPPAVATHRPSTKTQLSSARSFLQLVATVSYTP